MNEKIIDELLLLSAKVNKEQSEIISLLELLKENYTIESQMGEYINE